MSVQSDIFQLAHQILICELFSAPLCAYIGLRNFAQRIDPALEPLLCCVSPRNRGGSVSSSRASSRHSGSHDSPSRPGGEQELSPSKLIRVSTYDSLETRATYDEETTTNANADL